MRIQDILTKNPKLDGIFYSGGWPMFAPEAYTRALQSHQADIKSGKFVVTIAQAQLIEICKSLVQTPRLLILDEPTSSLSESETILLFRVIASLKAANV